MSGVGTDNDANREAWLKDQLARIPAGWRLLDAGAGEQRFRKYCGHLAYVAQGRSWRDRSPCARQPVIA